MQSGRSPRRGWGVGDKELARQMDKAQQEERGFPESRTHPNTRGGGWWEGPAGSRESLAGKMLRPLGALSRLIPALQRRGATRAQGG